MGFSKGERGAVPKGILGQGGGQRWFAKVTSYVEMFFSELVNGVINKIKLYFIC